MSFQITAEQSKLIRRQLGLSQRDVIEGSGIPAYVLKQWEARGLTIKTADHQRLRSWYELAASERGTTVEALAASSLPQQTSQVETGGAIERFGFLISPKLPSEVADQLMEDMEASDERIAAIVQTGIRSGALGGISSDSEILVQELFGHLAANHLRFRFLQGRNIIQATREEARTVGDYLSQWATANGVAHLAPAEDIEA